MNREFVDQPCIEIMLNDLRTAHDSGVFPPSDLPRLLQCALHPSLTKGNVVPPFRCHEPRGMWVRTNTGVWKGASSGQLASPSSNNLIPMIFAPVRLNISSTIL
jgi:hypothetical protein